MPHFHAAFSGGTVRQRPHRGRALGPARADRRAPRRRRRHPPVGDAVVPAGLPPRTVELDEHGTRCTRRPASRRAWLEPRTLLIGVVVFAAAFTEGTANDWIGVALSDGYGMPRWAGVLGFAVFLTAMTAGRLLGTRVLDRRGRVPVLRALFVAAVVGCLLVVFGGPALAFVGAAVWGVGASLGFPVGMSAAADEPAASRRTDQRRDDDRLHRLPRRAAAARLPRRPRRRAPLAPRRRWPRARRPLRGAGGAPAPAPPGTRGLSRPTGSGTVGLATVCP